MALANGKSTASNNEAHCPIDKFLEFRKGNFSCWNKDVEQTEIHDLDNFIVLDVGYTVKGAEWNDTLKQYTSRYFSNEIKDWKEKFYLVRTTFVNGKSEKELIKAGNWKADIKPVLPTGAALHIGLTILDLNDGIVKEVFLSGNLFFKISTFIKGVQSNEICGFKHGVAYTKGNTDDKGNEIMVSEEFVDSLKGTEAAQYKKRYTLDIYKTGELHNDALSISTLGDDLDKYFEAKRTYYVNTYDLGIEVKQEQPKFFKLPEEELTAEDLNNVFDPNNTDTEAELKKLNVPF